MQAEPRSNTTKHSHPMEATTAYLTALAMLVAVNSAAAGTIITADATPTQCVVTINNIPVIKNIGSEWKTNNSCEQHICALDDDGSPYERIVEETCVLNCKGEYEYRPSPDKCCGTCIKTKCLYNAKLYAVGETWRNDGDCVFLECSLHNGEAMISAYEKACPPVAADCPQSDLYQEDCCTYCRRRSEARFYSPEGDIGDLAYYRHHPCVRNCTAGEQPMVCKYTFVVEWYETLSKACYDCPHNITDCSRPHCIAADGVRRSVTVVNRMMPGPPIEVCLNDTIVVDVKNNMLGESTTIHWHGMHQKENPYMDGVPHVSQCPILPHSTFRYKFRASNVGTHFWHSHTGMQRGDGCFGSLIVRQPKQLDPHEKLYDFDLPEHRLLIQDWAHQPGVAMFASHHHSIGDNKPPNILINGRGRYYADIFKAANATAAATAKATVTTTAAPATEASTEDYSESYVETTVTPFEVENTTIPAFVVLYQADDTRNMRMDSPPLNRTRRSADVPLENLPLERLNVRQGYRYRIRIINAEFLNCPMTMSIDNHTLSVISSDGFDVEPVNVTAVVTYAGERFDFIVHADQPVGNYWIRLKGLIDCDERFTSAFQVGILHYEKAASSEPKGQPRYDFNHGGVELNSVNVGPGSAESLTINELRAMERADDNDTELFKDEADYKFFVYYDFYPKDNPEFHKANMYGINQMPHNSNRVFTPQLNHITMMMPSLPLMPAKHLLDDSMFCNDTMFKDQGIDCRKEFCKCHHVLQVPLNSVVELIMVDEGLAYDANHPFHLHGNAFRVVGLDRIRSNVTIEDIKEMDKNGQLHRNLDRPPIKDTVTVPDGGYTIVRFRASNPGYWLLHCHIEFHAEIGMALVIKVGQHHEMVPVPKNFPQCSDYIPALDDELEDAPRGGATSLYGITKHIVVCVLLSLLGAHVLA